MPGIHRHVPGRLLDDCGPCRSRAVTLHQTLKEAWAMYRNETKMPVMQLGSDWPVTVPELLLWLARKGGLEG